MSRPSGFDPGEGAGWLVEEDHSGIIHWIALNEVEAPWPKIREVRARRENHVLFNKHTSPVRRVKDSNDALRFARKEDAEAFIRMFGRFMLNPVATGHEWPTPDEGKPCTECNGETFCARCGR